MNKKTFKLFAAAIAAAGTITAFSAVSAGDIAVKSVDFAKGGKPVYLIEKGKINTVVNLEDGSAGSFSLLTVSYSEGGDRLLSINCKKITPESGKRFITATLSMQWQTARSRRFCGAIRSIP